MELSRSCSEHWGMPNRSSIYSGDPLLRKVGRAIRTERAALGISQEAFALLAGIDPSYYGAVERGDNNVTLLNLAKIAKHLGMPLSALLMKAKQ